MADLSALPDAVADAVRTPGDTEAPEPSTQPSTEQVASEVAAAVAAVPGVTRLVPSLTSALTRLAASRGGGQPRSGADGAGTPDGITVDRRGDAYEVSVDVAVDDSANVLATALLVQHAATERLPGTGDGPRHVVRVHVLALEAAPTT